MADPCDPVEERVDDAVWLLGEAVASIPARRRDWDRSILRQRLGLEGTAPTLQEIGDELDVTRERVRQIQQRALRHLGGRSAGATEWRGHLLEALGVQTPADANSEAVGRYVSEHLNGLNEHVAVKAIAHALRPPADRDRFAKAATSWLRAERGRQELERRERRPAGRGMEVVERMLAATWWPRGPLLTIDPSRQRRCREPTGGEGLAGTFESTKLNRLVAYESDLERAFLERLDRSDEVAFYQEQPVAIRWVEDGLRRRYCPDVLVVQRDGRALLVEVKQQWMMALRPTVDRLAAAVEFCSRKGLGLLVTDGRRSIDDLTDRMVPNGFATELERLVDIRGGVDPTTFMPLARRFGAHLADTAAAAIQLRLSWSMSPFELTRHPGAESFFASARARSLRPNEGS